MRRFSTSQVARQTFQNCQRSASHTCLILLNSRVPSSAGSCGKNEEKIRKETSRENCEFEVPEVCDYEPLILFARVRVPARCDRTSQSI
jgi:hypothetical protein